VLPALGHLQLDRITPAAVRQWHARTSAAIGPTATRQAYAVLHAILATAVADDALMRNPCRIAGPARPAARNGRCSTSSRYTGWPPACPPTCVG
jgi:hypothetical protein